MCETEPNILFVNNLGNSQILSLFPSIVLFLTMFGKRLRDWKKVINDREVTKMQTIPIIKENRCHKQFVGRHMYKKTRDNTEK